MSTRTEFILFLVLVLLGNAALFFWGITVAMELF